jgi:hypothetical protein
MSLNPAYTRVNSFGGEIRLLQLQPAKDPEAGLIGFLQPSLLGATNLPTYETLSYTWGGQGLEPRHITLSGVKVGITENLHAALLRLRGASSKPRLLWVDALCIDQSCATERAQQVRLMRDIYRNSSCTIIWLGELSIGAASGMRGLSGRTTNSLKNYTQNHQKPVLAGNAAGQIGGQLRILTSYTSTEDVMTSWNEISMGEVRELLTRPWWRRAWIVQEAVVSRKIVLMCGDEVVPWEHLSKRKDTRDDVVFLGLKLTPDEQVVDGRYRAILSFREKWQAEQGRNISLLELLYGFRSLECSDDRDRIFAFLGLSSIAKANIIIPDYELSATLLYKQFVRSIVWHTKNLDVLNCVREWAVGGETPQSYVAGFAYSPNDQLRYHDPSGPISKGPNNKPTAGWVRLPLGWERIPHGDGCLYFNHDSRTTQTQSPLTNAPPALPTSGKERRVLPSGWTKQWDNLGRPTYQVRGANTKKTGPYAVRGDFSTLPSWAPNWAGIAKHDPEPLLDFSSQTCKYSASRGTNAEVFTDTQNTNDDVLALRGIVFTEVVQIAQSWHPPSSTPPLSRRGYPILETWEFLALMPHPNCPYAHLPEGRRTALWQTYIGDGIANASAPYIYRNLVETWYDRVGWSKEFIAGQDALHSFGVFRKIKASTKMGLVEADWEQEFFNMEGSTDYFPQRYIRRSKEAREAYIRCIEQIHRTCGHRALFVSATGHMGVAPWNARVGDKVAVLKGGQTPFILRRVENDTTEGIAEKASNVPKYKLVGESYVSGIMGGEVFDMALRGWLSPGTQVLQLV